MVLLFFLSALAIALIPNPSSSTHLFILVMYATLSGLPTGLYYIIRGIIVFFATGRKSIIPSLEIALGLML
jgi:hypothetical protein